MLGSYLFTHSLTPCRRVLKQPTRSQLVKKVPAFYGTRRFIPPFTIATHLSLSWTRSIQSIPPHTTSWRSILILYYHLHLRTHISNYSAPVCVATSCWRFQAQDPEKSFISLSKKNVQLLSSFLTNLNLTARNTRLQGRFTHTRTYATSTSLTRVLSGLDSDCKSSELSITGYWVLCPSWRLR